ncbi:MAG: cupin domain-containing protein [Pseudomonadota bacterium]
MVHGSREGQENTGLGFKRWFRITPEDTHGRFAVFEEEVPEGAGPPLHVHKTEDEQFTVLSGSLKFHCNGDELVVGPGTTVLIPAGARHAFKGVGPGSSTILVMLTPGHGEGLFRDVAREKLDPHTDMARITEIAAEYGVEFVGPPLA